MIIAKKVYFHHYKRDTMFIIAKGMYCLSLQHGHIINHYKMDILFIIAKGPYFHYCNGDMFIIAKGTYFHHYKTDILFIIIKGTHCSPNQNGHIVHQYKRNILFTKREILFIILNDMCHSLGTIKPFLLNNGTYFYY